MSKATAQIPSSPVTSKRVIQCNVTEPTKIFPGGARAYVVLTNPGGGHERIVVLGRSRRGQWVEKWERIDRLDNFRVKTMPPEHPLYRSDRIWDVEEYISDTARLLQSAADRERSHPELTNRERWRRWATEHTKGRADD